jgi:ferredoxin
MTWPKLEPSPGIAIVPAMLISGFKIMFFKRRLNMAKRVVIDKDECIGCESCVELCAEVFAFNENEEKAEVILAEGGPQDCIEEAMSTCPVECIHWED